MSEPWYRQFWPWFLIALPGVVVIASLSMLFIAISHDDSRVRDNYYKEGLAINQTLAQDHAALARGISAILTLDPVGGVQLQLHGDFEQHPAALQLQFMHPLDSERDFSLTLRGIGGGDYVSTPDATLPRPLDGRWHVELSPATAADTGEPSRDDAAGGSHWRLRNPLRFDGSARFELLPQERP